MAPLPTERRRVLVIDDDPVLRELLCALLSAEDETIGEVDTAESGESALALLAEGSSRGALPNVILTDMQLPGLAGANLAASLRRAVPDACLLAMSGSQPRSSDRTAFDGFLLKPFSTHDVLTLLASCGERVPTQPVAATTPQASPALPELHPAPLDEALYARLAAALPAAQLAELYRLTFEDIGTRLALMRDALVSGDRETVRREAHALKGGCSMVGAVELAALAKQAEFADSPDVEHAAAGSSGDTPSLEEFTAAADRLRSIMTARSEVTPE